MKKKSLAPCTPKAPVLPHETIEIAERKEILLTGVLGIEDYHMEKVRIKTVKGFVELQGNSISLCWAGEKRLLLRGNFQTLHFEKKSDEKGCRRC